jgi:hypothetical protein
MGLIARLVHVQAPTGGIAAPSQPPASRLLVDGFNLGDRRAVRRVLAFARLTRRVHGGDWMPNRLRQAWSRRGSGHQLWATAPINGDRYCFSPSRPKNLRTEFAVRFRKVERPSVFREA